MRVRNPHTSAQWREAVLGAHALRALYDCSLYGLIEGCPNINVDRCDQLIAQGNLRGLRFTAEEVTNAAVGFAAAFNEEVSKRDNERTDPGTGGEHLQVQDTKTPEPDPVR